MRYDTQTGQHILPANYTHKQQIAGNLMQYNSRYWFLSDML